MKSKLKTTSLIYIIFLFTGIFSCTDCGPFPDKSRVKNIFLNMYRINTNNGIDFSNIENNEIVYDKLAFEITPEIDNYFSFKNKLYSFSFIQNAYACDPTPPEMVDKIENIELISNNSYNDTFPANTNLSEIVNVIIPSITNESISLNEYLQTNPTFPNSLILILNEAPDTNRIHRFTLKIFTNGQLLNYKEYEFEPIEVKVN